LTFSWVWGDPRKLKLDITNLLKKITGIWRNILTKTYEDAISDVLAILEHYTGVAVYNVNLIPIIDRIKALNTTDPKELKPDITKDVKISREVLDEAEYMLRLSQ
jgi:hypothetical protein